jgi:hypothetical protein
MPLPRPASPRVLWNDIRALIAEKGSHRLLAAVVAVLMPLSIIVIFYYDGQTNVLPGPQLIYAESWPADRSDEEIIAKQKVDQAELEEWRENRRQQFERIDKALERLGI